MPAFWMEATLYTLDQQSFDKLLKKWQNEIMRGAVKRFLQAAIRRIPVRTGFLRGAFTDIRREFADTTSDPGLNPALAELFSHKEAFKEAEEAKDAKLSAAGREARIRALQREMKKGLKRQNKGKKGSERGRMKEYYYSGTGKGAKKILKTPRSGIQFATKPENVLKIQDNIAIFFLDITISYYRINDNYSRIKGAPWNSMMEGGSAMANWLGRCADLFPAITEILARQKIVLRGSRLSQTKLPQEVRASRLLTIGGLEGANVSPSGSPPPSPSRASAKNALIKARLRAARESKAKSGKTERWPFPVHKKGKVE